MMPAFIKNFAMIRIILKSFLKVIFQETPLTKYVKQTLKNAIVNGKIQIIRFLFMYRKMDENGITISDLATFKC